MQSILFDTPWLPNFGVHQAVWHIRECRLLLSLPIMDERTFYKNGCCSDMCVKVSVTLLSSIKRLNYNSVMSSRSKYRRNLVRYKFSIQR